MSDSNLTVLLAEHSPEVSFFEELANKNREDFLRQTDPVDHYSDTLNKVVEQQVKDNPDLIKTPSALDMAKISLWHKQYLKKNPKASARNAKRATIRHFNLNIQK